MSIATVKAALHRGRARLRQLAREADDIPLLILGEPERLLLAAYVERFNARDFVAIRDMLADEVRLDLVAKLHKKVRTEVATYNYARLEDRNFVLGLVDRRTAVLVRNPSDPTGKVAYFILLQWEGDRVANIREYTACVNRRCAKASNRVNPWNLRARRRRGFGLVWKESGR